MPDRNPQQRKDRALNERHSISIAVLSRDEDDVALVNGTLRDGGHAAHCRWIDRPDKLDETLAAQRVELIIINCDRAKMYFNGKRLQWCWAHLKRDIQKLIDSQDNQVKRLGHDLMRQQRLLFEQWHVYQDNKISWKSFRRKIAPIRQEFDSLLLRGCFSGNQKLIGMCDELYKHRSWLWTFTEIEGIEPTNNTAERALRPAVIYRKLSFGTQSASGSRFIERILTLSETCRLQNCSPFQYLVAAMKAHFSQQTPPSLLPTEKTATKRKAA